MTTSSKITKTEDKKDVVAAPIFPINVIFLSLATLTMMIISTITTLYIANQRAKTKNSVRVNLNQDLTKISAPANWKTYSNAKYSFSLKYPNTWTYALEGPNAAMIDLQNGKSISGTLLPTFNTIDFFNPYINKEFSIGIYPANKISLTPDQFENGYLYMSGSCDLRDGFNPKSIDIVVSNNIKILRVVGNKEFASQPNYASNNIACFYLTNSNGNLIVLSATPTSPNNDFSIYNQILSTFKFTN